MRNKRAKFHNFIFSLSVYIFLFIFSRGERSSFLCVAHAQPLYTTTQHIELYNETLNISHYAKYTHLFKCSGSFGCGFCISNILFGCCHTHKYIRTTTNVIIMICAKKTNAMKIINAIPSYKMTGKRERVRKTGPNNFIHIHRGMCVCVCVCILSGFLAILIGLYFLFAPCYLVSQIECTIHIHLRVHCPIVIAQTLDLLLYVCILFFF